MNPLVLQTVPELVTDLTGATLRIVGLAIAAGLVTAIAAAGYRWYARDRLPTGVGVLIGAAVIAIEINATVALGDAIGGETRVLAPATALVNAVTFLIGGVVADAGRRAGDQVGTSLSAVTGTRELTGRVGRIVETVGGMTAVTLPETIEDLDAYDPVAQGVKETLAGKTLLFPGRLTGDDLRNALLTRLKDEYAVGHVGVEFDEDGTVSYLGLGSRAAGVGTTVPPGTAVVAVRADPASAASPGDVVQVWRTDGESPERLTTGELRATTGDVATVATDEHEARAIDPDVSHRLVTLPGNIRADREFAALLRNADETMRPVTVAAGSDLVGLAVGALDVTVVGIQSVDGGTEPLPPRDRVLAAEETVYAVARPERLRRLEAAASVPDTETAPAQEIPSGSTADGTEAS